MRSFLPRFLFLGCTTLALGATTLACTAADGEDVGEQEGEWRARPGGQDSTIGSLLVDAPALPAGTQLLVGKYTVGHNTDQRIPGVTTDLGKPTTGLAVGETSLELTDAVLAFPKIKAGETATIHLGAVFTKRDAARPTVGLQVATDLAPGFAYGDTTAIPGVRYISGKFNAGVAQNVAQAVPAGTYYAAFGFLDGATVKVTAGGLATLDLSANAGRRIARIVPAPRELPDARCSNAFNGERAIKITGPGSSADFAHAQVVLDQPFEIGQNEAIVKRNLRKNIPRDLTYTLPCVSYPTKLPLGAVDAGPLEVKLGRIDVDDIAVTQNNGTVATVRGTYQVYDKDGNGMLDYPLETNTGTDLPPGTYDVVATYRKTDGTTGTWKSHFTTP